jgi:hypothetical protein
MGALMIAVTVDSDRVRLKPAEVLQIQQELSWTSRFLQDLFAGSDNFYAVVRAFFK